MSSKIRYTFTVTFAVFSPRNSPNRSQLCDQASKFGFKNWLKNNAGYSAFSESVQALKILTEIKS